jgi:arylformamidase
MGRRLSAIRGKETMYYLLSYPLGIKTSLFGTNPPNVFKQIESIRKGDHCNSRLITFFSHNGTHMDAPRHFDEKGKKIVDYRIEDFIFEKPRLIEVPKEEDGAIGLSDLLEHE